MEVEKALVCRSYGFAGSLHKLQAVGKCSKYVRTVDLNVIMKELPVVERGKTVLVKRMKMKTLILEYLCSISSKNGGNEAKI